MIRAPLRGEPSFDGMEIQILDDRSPAYRNLKPDQYTGSVYGVVAARRGQAKPPGEWNALEIRAEGPKVRVQLNGVVVVDEADLSGRTKARARHPGICRRSGYIGLQLHETSVEFRDIRIRELR